MSPWADARSNSTPLEGPRRVETRSHATSSRDPRLVRALWSGYAIHAPRGAQSPLLRPPLALAKNRQYRSQTRRRPRHYTRDTEPDPFVCSPYPTVQNASPHALRYDTAPAPRCDLSHLPRRLIPPLAPRLLRPVHRLVSVIPTGPRLQHSLRVSLQPIEPD